MRSETLQSVSLKMLEEKAILLRIHSVEATTAAGSGHPTSCASAAEIVSTLFFSVMRFDPKEPKSANGDIFVLSKGHAAPLLYAAWAEAGTIPVESLLTLRRVDSDLEGHPTPRLPFVDVATGSLGQGLSVALGMALNAKLRSSPQRVFVLMGDGESAEGSVWEAAEWAPKHGLGNLCATIDVNRLGQSEPTLLQHDMETYRARWEAFGWQALVVDGHDISALLEAYEKAADTKDRPTIVLARTMKGKGLPKIEGDEHWHGKALDKETAKTVVAGLRKQVSGAASQWKPRLPERGTGGASKGGSVKAPAAPYAVGGKAVATRKAFGDALGALASLDERIVTVDGDVKNSTYTQEFEKAAPERFFQGYIAEQNMVGMAMGFAARGRVPFTSTFACFLSRAYDFIRMAAISGLNVKLVGTHAGVSIGEDGPSQMGLEDLAMMAAQPGFTVLYPSDATSAWNATCLAAENAGGYYLRIGRPNAPVLYGPEEQFRVGKCKVLRKSDEDKAVVVGAGVTLFEALKAYDRLKEEGIAVRVIDLFSVKPIDEEGLREAAHAAGGIVVTVEDHYEHGGIGDAVLSALAGEGAKVYKLAVKEVARSGKPEELLDKFGISASHIVTAVKEALRR